MHIAAEQGHATSLQSTAILIALSTCCSLDTVPVRSLSVMLSVQSLGMLSNSDGTMPIKLLKPRDVGSRAINTGPAQ